MLCSPVQVPTSTHASANRLRCTNCTGLVAHTRSDSCEKVLAELGRHDHGRIHRYIQKIRPGLGVELSLVFLGFSCLFDGFRLRIPPAISFVLSSKVLAFGIFVVAPPPPKTKTTRSVVRTCFVYWALLGLFLENAVLLLSLLS